METNNPAAEAPAKCKWEKSRKYSKTYLKLGLYINISFCEDLCIPTRTHLTYNNDKPWFTAELRQVRQAKQDAYRNGDKILYKQAKYTLEKEIRVAKMNFSDYSDKLRIQFSSIDSTSVCKDLKDNQLQDTTPSTVENQHLADDLNEFYCRFEKTPHACSGNLSTQPPPINTSSNPPLPYTLQFRSAKMRSVRSSGSRKGKNHQAQTVTPVYLNSCAEQLASIFTKIFNRSLELCEVISCFKRSTIIPIQNYRTKWIQACGSNVSGHEVIWKTVAGPPEGHYWTLAGSSSVCLQSKQVCGWCSQHGTTLCSATSRQTKDLCEDPVCGLRRSVYTRHNLFAHSSCTSLLILLCIKSTVYCIAHFILLHILLCIFIFYLYLYILYCVVLRILHCPLSGPDLIYISLRIIFCIIEYVMNKKTLNLGLQLGL